MPLFLCAGLAVAQGVDVEAEPPGEGTMDEYLLLRTVNPDGSETYTCDSKAQADQLEETLVARARIYKRKGNVFTVQPER